MIHLFHKWTAWEPVQVSQRHNGCEGLDFWVPGERRQCRKCPKVQRRRAGRR